MSIPRIVNAGPPIGVGGGPATITLVEANTSFVNLPAERPVG
jgi:hypothetical protein